MLMREPFVEYSVIYFNGMEALILRIWLFVPGIFIVFEL